ncbi:hypothetical protein [Streptomyces sp. NBC_01615]
MSAADVFGPGTDLGEVGLLTLRPGVVAVSLDEIAFAEVMCDPGKDHLA